VVVTSPSLSYSALLRSPRWQAMRRARIAWCGWRCERCDCLAYDLELHHLNYDRLGEERAEDLVLLCPPCHREADAERRSAADEAHWKRRLDGWASRVFGDGWTWTPGYEAAEEAFCAWLRLEDW
jgi:5-methylcytosine-specific restriction endonuclease McrA